MILNAIEKCWLGVPGYTCVIDDAGDLWLTSYVCFYVTWSVINVYTAKEYFNMLRLNAGHSYE